MEITDVCRNRFCCCNECKLFYKSRFALSIFLFYRHFSDADKDISHVSADSCGRSASRRSSIRRVNRTERNISDYSGPRARGDQSSSSRQRLQSNKDQQGSVYPRHHGAKDSALENSPSPSDAYGHTKSRHFHVRPSHRKFPDTSPTEEHSSPRRTTSQVHDAVWRSIRNPGTTSKALRPATSSRTAVQQASHYLDETDDVSSGSLSPDLEPEGSISDSSIIHGAHSKSQRLSSSSVSRELSSAKRQDPSCADPISRDCNHTHSHKTHGRYCRDSVSPISSKKMRSVDSSRATCQVHMQSNSTAMRTPNSPHSALNREFLDRTLSRSPSRESYLERKIKSSTRVSGASFEAKIERASRSRDLHTRCSYHSDDKTSLHCQSVELCAESHDTLTKLELERAKLLRELSMLNNEVGGHKLKPSVKKRPPSDSSDQLYTPKIR